MGVRWEWYTKTEDSDRSYFPRQPSERNLLQLQGKDEAVPNHEMQLHESWNACGVCCGHCSNGADVVDVGSDEEENDQKFGYSYCRSCNQYFNCWFYIHAHIFT